MMATKHSANKLDAIFKRYEAIAEEQHRNAQFRAEFIAELRAEQNTEWSKERLREINQHQDDLAYFRQLYRATVRKMDLIRQLIELEENFPTSAFL